MRVAFAGNESVNASSFTMSGVALRVHDHELAAPPSAQVEILRDVPMYQLDPVLRRATALQLTRLGREPALEFRP